MIECKCGLKTEASGRNMFCFRKNCPKVRTPQLELREETTGDFERLQKAKEEQQK